MFVHTVHVSTDSAGQKKKKYGQGNPFTVLLKALLFANFSLFFCDKAFKMSKTSKITYLREPDPHGSADSTDSKRICISNVAPVDVSGNYILLCIFY